MRIDDFLRISGGELLNSPKISKFLGFSSNFSKLKRGDLFFCKNEQELALAFENGAYGVVSEKLSKELLQSGEQEGAIIYVKNLQKAIYSLLRFFLIHKNITIVYLEYREFVLLKNISQEAGFFDEDENLLSNFCDLVFGEKLDGEPNILENSTNNIYFFTKNIDLIKNIDLNYITLVSDASIKYILSKTFESDFVWNEKYFKNIRIIEPDIKYLVNVLEFLEIRQIDYDLNNLKNNILFYPIFLNSYNKITEFGQSEKIIIIEEEVGLFERGVKHLKKTSSWGKIKYNLEQNDNFNFAYIIGNRDDYIKLFKDSEKKIEQKLLFTFLADT